MSAKVEPSDLEVRTVEGHIGLDFGTYFDFWHMFRLLAYILTFGIYFGFWY